MHHSKFLKPAAFITAFSMIFSSGLLNESNTRILAYDEYSESDDSHEYSLLDQVNPVPNDTIPCYNQTDSMKLIATYTVTEKDKKIIQDFMDEYLSDDMTVTEKIKFTKAWLYQNVEYAETTEEYFKLSASLAECGFVMKSGQCLQYNGALAYMLAYMGFDTRLIFTEKTQTTNQHFTCQVIINGRIYGMEVGNKGTNGRHYMPASFLRPADPDSYTGEYVKPAELKGDADNDGRISVSDIMNVSSFLLEFSPVNSTENADINDDGKIDVFDLARLKKIIINM